MTTFSKLALMALLTGSLLACGSDEKTSGAIPQGQLDAMDKARDVENVLNNAKNKQLEGIDNPG